MLSDKTLSELKAIASEYNLTPDDVRGFGSLTKKTTWVSAIENAQTQAEPTKPSYLPADKETLATVVSQKLTYQVLPSEVQTLYINSTDITVNLASGEAIAFGKGEIQELAKAALPTLAPSCPLHPQAEYRLWSWTNQCCHSATRTLAEWRDRKDDFLAASLGTEVCLFSVANDPDDLPTDSWQVEMDIRKAIHEKGFSDGAAGLPMLLPHHLSYQAGHGRGWRDHQWKPSAPAEISLPSEKDEEQLPSSPGTWQHTSELCLLEKIQISTSEEPEESKAPTKGFLLKFDATYFKAPEANPKFHFGQCVCTVNDREQIGFIQSIHIKVDLYTRASIWQYTVNSPSLEFGYYKFDGSFLWKESELAPINESNVTPNSKNEVVFDSQGTPTSIDILQKDINLMIKDLKLFHYIPIRKKGTISDPTPWIEVFWVEEADPKQKKEKIGEIYWRGASWNASEELEEFMGDFCAFASQAGIPEERLP